MILVFVGGATKHFRKWANSTQKGFSEIPAGSFRNDSNHKAGLFELVCLKINRKPEDSSSDAL